MEPPYGVPDGGAHPLDLVLPALVECQLDRRRCEQSRLRRRCSAIVELDTPRELPERIGIQLALHLDLVDLLDAVARVREPVRERAVVREQERAGRVRVEAADRNDALREVDEIDDGPAPARIPGRRHRPGRLVQEDVGEPLRHDRVSVHFDAVSARDERVQSARITVDGDAARLDQIVRAPARRDPGAREIGVQPHGAYSRGSCRTTSP